jgi:hypothetical protein
MTTAGRPSRRTAVQKPPQSKAIDGFMLLAKDATGALAAMASVMAFAAATPALSRPSLTHPSSWRDVLFGDSHSRDDRRSPAPPVGRYVSGEGDRFVLDRSSGVTLMKFEDSQEVFALSPSQAPRGDVIYRNDLGEPVLRATRLGGLTLFYRARSGGTPAALDGTAANLRLSYLPPGLLLQRLAQASVRASHAAQHLIEFDAPDVVPGTQAVYADAAAVAAEAMMRLSKGPGGRAVLAKIRRVVLLSGRKSSASFKGQEMKIIIKTADGLAGRPSSDSIIMATAKR